VASLVDFAYYGALLIMSPVAAVKFGRKRGRRHLVGLRERLGACRRRGAGQRCIWIHGVSVGEILAAAPLIEALGESFPDYEIVLSTTTSTGQEVAKKAYPGLRVIYYPLDFTWAVRRVLDAIRPDLVILVELEIWPNFLSEAYRRKIPVALVNGRISERSFSRYRYVRGWLFDPLGKVGRFCVQTERYADRFRKLGLPAEQIYVTGSMKYDQLKLSQADGAETRKDMGIGPDETVLIGGSTHPSEERALVDAYRELRKEFSDLRLVLVPRHTERAPEVAKIVREAVGEPVLRSQQVQAEDHALDPGAVLLVDTIGELGRLYCAADVVFVGGSLIPHGGQNMLEPVAFGKPTVFGPYWDNFKEQVERLSAANGVREVKDTRELTQVLGQILRNPEEARDMGVRGRDALLAARGATKRTLEVLRNYLEERSA